jgi:chemotaxis protein methyltransferase CheR
MSAGDPHLQVLSDLLREHAGISFHSRQLPTLATAARAAMTQTGSTELRTLVERAREDREVLDAVVDELSIGETYFFRLPEQFDLIAREVIPSIQEERGPGHVVRIWSAGCASGEEPYSLAILCDELEVLDRTRILATDISRRTLAKARQGLFRPWSLRDRGRRAMPYLQPESGGYRLADKIRDHVVFEYLNLAYDSYPSAANGTWAQDLILCRNVLLYFSPETIERVASRLFGALAEGGWLLLGPSDPLLSGLAPFDVKVTDGGVVYRRLGEGRERWYSGLSTHPSDTTSSTGSASGPGEVARGEGENARDRSLAPEGGSHDPMPSVDVGPEPSHSTSGPGSVLEAAREAFEEGNYRAVVALARQETHSEECATLLVRALSNIGDQIEAGRAAERALTLHPMSRELRYLYAVLLMEGGHGENALQNIRKLLYVDSRLAAAHFVHGLLLGKKGDSNGSRRAFWRTRQLAASLPPDAVVPLSDGEKASRLMEAADVQLALLDSEGEGRS